MSKRQPVSVIGGGAWGRALAAAAARTGDETLLYSRRSLDGSLPQGVKQARDMKEVAHEARLIILAVPSFAVRDVARSLGEFVDGRHYVVHGVRGLVGDDVETISDVVREETPARRVGALGGPAVAEDLLAGSPSVLVSGSHYPEVNQAVVGAFVAPGDSRLRVYTTSDLRGLEWASALVGCLAIGVGYAQAAKLTPGLMAAVISRAVHEAARLAHAAGGEEQTLLGLAGYGDLLASTTQTGRPEVTLGAALAQNKTIEEALRAVGERVEAVELIPRVVAWAERRGVRCPIFTALARGVFTARPAEGLVRELMTGPVEDRP